MLAMNADDREKIDAVLDAGKIIDQRILEKDILVTRAIAVLSKFNPGKIVFSGGTSLFKGFGIIGRMSEDIDFKIRISYAEGETRTSSQDRKKRGKIKHAMEENLAAAGFFPPNTRARDNNSFFSFLIPFESVYPEWQVLRPAIKIECIDVPLAFAPVEREIRSLADEILGTSEPECVIPCQNPRETLVEKTVALLRRPTDERPKFSDNPNLVRHIHDSARIVLAGVDVTSEMVEVFGKKVEAEIVRYGNHCRAFAENPKATLLESLGRLHTERRFRDDYEERIRPMLLDDGDLDYDDCLELFSKAANILVGSLPDELEVKP